MKLDASGSKHGNEDLGPVKIESFLMSWETLVPENDFAPESVDIYVT